jgi:hypothetical protein
MDSQPGALNSITEEIVRSKYNGNYKKYTEAVAALIKSDYDQAATSAAVPYAPGKAPGEPPRPMTPSEAAKRMATDFMLETHFPQYQQTGTKTLDINKTSTSKSGSGKDAPTATQGRVVEQMQMTNDSYVKLGNVDYGQVLSTMGKERSASENTADVNNALNKINKDKGFIASSPTIYFNTGAAEPLTLSGGQSVNPLNMWYNKKDGSLYLLYDNKASAKGTSPSFKVNQVRVTKEEAASLLANTGTNIKATVEQWNLYAKQKGLPTLNDVADGRASSTRTTTRTPSGGKKKKVF